MFKALGLREGGRDHLGEDQSASAHNQDWQDWSLAQSWKGDILADENIPGMQFNISENGCRISFVFFQEHCLVGSKGSIPLNRGLDCDVIVAEVRATSHKPDEIYGIIERLSPGTRKIELFGRPHNVQPNWVTLGNQLDGVMIRDPEMFERWKKVYPEGYNIAENFILHPRQE